MTETKNAQFFEIRCRSLV